MSVTVIVPLFNRWDMTEGCLAALEETAPGVQVVTVDNGSSDETAAYDVTIRNPRNRGFAVACNQGARAATGDTLIFLNNDTEPQVGWLEGLQGCAGIAGPHLVYPSGLTQSAGIGVDFSQPPGGEAFNLTEVGPGREVDAVTGACLAVSRECWGAVGGFDTGYYNG